VVLEQNFALLYILDSQEAGTQRSNEYKNYKNLIFRIFLISKEHLKLMLLHKKYEKQKLVVQKLGNYIN